MRDPARGELRFYIGQPGILDDIPAIERGEEVWYGWWRVAVPAAQLTAGAAHLDLASSPDVQFWQFFTYEPGCGLDRTWLGKWSSGSPGVSGTVDVTEAQGAFEMAFDFTYTGVFDTSCGTPGTVSSSNRVAGSIEL